jgi:hypothetical protein
LLNHLGTDRHRTCCYEEKPQEPGIFFRYNSYTFDFFADERVNVSINDSLLA